MPLPERLPAINRRVTNPFMRLFAGWLPPFAIVVHRGRTSGREYRTPVLAFPDGAAVVIALTYGVERDWVKNVQAAGGCTLVRGGFSIPVVAPRVLDEGEGMPLMPRPVRLILRLTKVDRFLRLAPAAAIGA